MSTVQQCKMSVFGILWNNSSCISLVSSDVLLYVENLTTLFALDIRPFLSDIILLHKSFISSDYFRSPLSAPLVHDSLHSLSFFCDRDSYDATGCPFCWTFDFDAFVLYRCLRFLLYSFP